MAPTSNILRAARPAFRQAAFFSSAAAASRPTMQNTMRFRIRFRDAGRRWQSTAPPAAEARPSLFQRLWDSPVGLKTVHFWAPIMKWAIVIAGISDFARPAEKLSLTQNLALTATGIIWTRWCLIIKPKNYLLAAVNFFLGIVGIIQVSRIVIYQQSQKAIKPSVEAEKVKADAA